MKYIDLHTHSVFSFDGCESVESLCLSAIEKGISILAITDHYDIDGEVEDYYPHYSDIPAKKDIFDAKEKFKDKLELLYGIELGQAHSYPEKALDFVKEHNFDFVIASLHNLKKTPDFDMLKYEIMPQKLIELLWKRYLEEMYNEIIPLSDKIGISTMAHLTYPLRYIKIAGKDIDLSPYTSSFTDIFKEMIKKGIALEINTSSIRRGLGDTLPGYEIVKLYRQCGGEYLTVGSDAHFSKDIGANVADAYEVARNVGFKSITWLSNGKEYSIDL